jgi:tRNA pseudouridine38-40 synthase
MPVALLLSYDGTDFHGYQRQSPSHEPTIQGCLESALCRISGKTITTQVAGRTDAGVHASGQVVTFTAEHPTRFQPSDWMRAVNALLPSAIAVRGACAVPEGIHARFTALSRSYRYRLLLDATRNPLRERFAWRAGFALDVRLMQSAAAVLVGIHDFAAFGHSPENRRGQPKQHSIRDLRQVTIVQRADEIWCDFTANAFLTGMVRRMVGTLILTGRGCLSSDDIATILALRQSEHPGAAAPPHGLCLTHVEFPPGTVSWPAEQHDGDYHDHL